MIDRFYREAEEDEREATTTWTVQNINNLLKVVALENIGQLRGCYITSKMDPSVFVEPERDDVMAAEAAEADKQNAKLLCNYNFSWKPKFHVGAFERETKRAQDGSLEPNGRASEKTAMGFFTTSPILWHNFMAIQ
jgi:hypothetical protein